MDTHPESGYVLYLDGHNNPGFSGGPVIFANYSKQDRLQIAGVVSGCRTQPTEVLDVEVEESQSSTGEKQKKIIHYVPENAGIIVAYSFSEYRVERLSARIPSVFQLQNWGSQISVYFDLMRISLRFLHYIRSTARHRLFSFL